MVRRFECSFLAGPVECTAERERHILAFHPELGDDAPSRIAEVLREPDQVRKSSRSHNARIFSRWYMERWGGKHLVVVVVSDTHEKRTRHWIVTAYVTRRLSDLEVEWRRD